MNGYQMRGVIAAFDPYVVVLMSDSRQQVIYKHAISTITPERAVELEPEGSAPVPFRRSLPGNTHFSARTLQFRRRSRERDDP